MSHQLNLSVISVQKLSDPDEQQRLLHAAQTVGFIRLADFPEPQCFKRVLELAEQFFALPSEQKHRVATQAYVAENPNLYRGYFPPLQGTNALKEGFEIGPPGAQDATNPLYEPNPYPSGLTEHWQRDLEAYYVQMQTLGLAILHAFEQSLGLPSTRLTERFQHGVSTLRLIHYPEGNEIAGNTLQNEAGDAFSTPAHVDSGILTLLLQDDTGGLQARHRSGEWLDIEPVPGTLVMNLGALLETLTGGRVNATEHRVKMPRHSRYSIPFFMEPAADAEVTELFSGSNPLGLPDYQTYLVRQMANFVEYKSLVEVLSEK